MGLRYLNGRRLRTTLTTLAIVFGVALIFAINLVLPSAMNVFKQSMLEHHRRGYQHSPAVSGESFAPDSGACRVSAAVAQVQAVTGILRRAVQPADCQWQQPGQHRANHADRH